MKTTKQYIKALEDELGFCLYKLQGMFPLDHWKIRSVEIQAELKRIKGKDKSNVKSTKARKRKAVR